MGADRLILASRSPQRRAILQQLGVDFVVEVPEVEEIEDGDPRALVLENARRKATAVAERRLGEASADAGGAATERILAVDTAVVLDGRPYGKPRDEREASSFLRALSGREHEVMSAIVLREGGEERSEVPVTRVRFRPLEGPEIARYAGSGEWRERAGGYAIQGLGASLVERVEGDYFNVVGLPVAALVRLLPDLFR